MHSGQIHKDNHAFSEREWHLRLNETPSVGAHLVATRRGYTHHGIYVGNEKVVHYAGLSRGLNVGPVEEVPLAEFVRGHAVSVRLYSNPRFDRRGIIERARSRLGEDSYRLLTNNCEHFCEWCVLGTSRSQQVERLRYGPSRLLVSAGRAMARRVRDWLAVDPRNGGWAV